ncbi:MAG: hypothetical protein ACI8R4_004134 [Paracoccaceae bacterium]|jgi:hypothetical protein
MQGSKIFFARLICAAGNTSPTNLAAQPIGYTAPVPGPYQAIPATVAAANPYSNPGFAQPLPYWMRPPQQQANTAPAAPRSGQSPGQPAPRAAGPTYIPGWVWSPYAPNAGRSAPRQGAHPPAGYAPGYQPGDQPGYGPQPGQPAWPFSPAPGVFNSPQGPADFGPNGAVRHPQQ